jgi:hypothetical protein
MFCQAWVRTSDRERGKTTFALPDLSPDAALLQCGKWPVDKANPFRFAAALKMRLAFFTPPQVQPSGLAARFEMCSR